MALGCDADVEAFEASCKARLFPGEWNFWWLHRTLETAGVAPAQSEIEVLLGATKIQRFSGIQGPWGSEMGSNLNDPKLKYVVDHVEAHDMTGKDVTIRGQVDGERLAEVLRSLERLTESQTLERVGDRTQCTPLPLTSGPSTSILVAFFYNGTKTEMPWPVHTYSFFGTDCPLDTDWQLDAIYRPLVRKDKPDEPRDIFPDVPVEVKTAGALYAAFILVGLGVVTAVAVKAVR